MDKVYKRIGGKLHYHEAWVDGGTLTEHWGVVGDKLWLALHAASGIVE